MQVNRKGLRHKVNCINSPNMSLSFMDLRLYSKKVIKQPSQTPHYEKVGKTILMKGPKE